MPNMHLPSFPKIPSSPRQSFRRDASERDSYWKEFVSHSPETIARKLLHDVATLDSRGTPSPQAMHILKLVHNVDVIKMVSFFPSSVIPDLSRASGMNLSRPNTPGILRPGSRARVLSGLRQTS